MLDSGLFCFAKCLVIYGLERQKADGWLLDSRTQITPDTHTEMTFGMYLGLNYIKRANVACVPSQIMLDAR